MDNALSQSSAEVIQEVVKWVRAGGDLATAEAPEIARQYLAWQMYQSVIGVVLFGLPSIGSIVFAIYSWKQDQNTNEDWEAWVILGSISGIATFALAISDAIKVARILVAPKIVLLEGLAALVK